MVVCSSSRLVRYNSGTGRTDRFNGMGGYQSTRRTVLDSPVVERERKIEESERKTAVCSSCLGAMTGGGSNADEP